MKAERLLRAISLVILAGVTFTLGPTNTLANNFVCRSPSDSCNNTLENRPAAVPNTLMLTSKLWLPLVTNNWCSPSIEFTYVPPYGSFENLQGWVKCVKPPDYRVAVYIYVAGWWNKPYWSSPLTPINDDGSWVCDITTGGTDQLATKIAAFLVPNWYNPPRMSGGQTFPAELFTTAVAYVMVNRPAVPTMGFSGNNCKVKKLDAG